MARGRKPKLDAIKRLEGNPGNRPLADLEDQIAAAGDVFIPEHLDEDAAACIEVVRSSMPAGVYARLDTYVLSVFATAWALHKRAAFEMTNPAFEHVGTNSAGNLAKNPWIEILNSQARIMMAAGDRLGLDPKARAALRLPKDDQPKSKFAGLIGQTGSSPSSKH